MLGEEIWLNGEGDFPIDVAPLILPVHSQQHLKGAVIQIREIETTLLNEHNEPCKLYSNEIEESVKHFGDCCKNAIKQLLTDNFTCWIPPMASILPLNSTWKSCQNVTEGYTAIQSYRKFYTSISDSPGKDKKDKKLRFFKGKLRGKGGKERRTVWVDGVGGGGWGMFKSE